MITSSSGSADNTTVTTSPDLVVLQNNNSIYLSNFASSENAILYTLSFQRDHYELHSYSAVLSESENFIKIYTRGLNKTNAVESEPSNEISIYKLYVQNMSISEIVGESEIKIFKETIMVEKNVSTIETSKIRL